YVDLLTGDIHCDDEDDMHPDGMGADEAGDDPFDDRDRWLRFDNEGSRDGWEDMRAFAERQSHEALRTRMERALEGKGAFRRFRDLVHDEGIFPQWEAFSTDRQWGRVRAFLAAAGVRVI